MLSAAEFGHPHPPEVPLKRKIAAIVAADVAGYSRLVAEDEEGTLRALSNARRIFDELVQRGGGRIFNTAGDSVMCDFDSAVEAVRVALRIQDEIRQANSAVPVSKRLQFRIGITIGDVVERGQDLLGDGVNIAARLEGIAPAGGICISRSVHEAVANKVDVAFRDLGPQTLKNLPQQMQAFVFSPDAAAAISAPPSGTQNPFKRASARGARTAMSRPALVGAGLALAVLTGGIMAFDRVRDTTAAWFGPPELRPSASASSGAAAPAPASSPRGPAPRSAQTTAPKLAATSEHPASADKTPSGSAPAPATGENASPEPKTVAAQYREARLIEAKGDRAGALRLYAALAPAAGEAIDPLIRYAALLRRTEGPDAARKAIERLESADPSKSLLLVGALQADGPERIAKLESLVAEHPDYAPAHLLLAQALTDKRKDGPTLTERRLAFSALDRFLEAAQAGALAPFFLDRSFLDGWIDAARARRSEIESFFASAATRPTATFSRVEGGWRAEITLPEPATSVVARIGENGTPSPVDTPSGSLATILVPGATGRTTIYVSYWDVTGREAGPFPILFDPAVAAASSGREVLERYPDSWVSFRSDLPNLLSFAQLVSNRCAVRQALIGFGDEAPTRPIPLPACDAGSAQRSSADTRSILELPAGTDAVQVQLTYANGAESQVRMFRRP